MAQGLRHRPMRICRFGIGVMLLGAAVGCHGTDKAPTSKLPPIPPPRLPAEAPAPGTRTSAPATTAPTRQPAAAASNNFDPSTAFPPGLGSQMGTTAAPPSPVNQANFNGPAAAPASTVRSSQSPTISAASSSESYTPYPPRGGLADPTPPPPPPTRSSATTPPVATPIATPEMPADKPLPSGGASGGIMMPPSLSSK